MAAKKSAPKPVTKSVATKPAARKAAPAKPAAAKAPVAKKAAPAKKAAAVPAPKAAPKAAPAKKVVPASAPKKAAAKAPVAKVAPSKKAAPAKVAAVAAPKASNELVEVLFERYSPNSGAVDLVGSFNDWKLGKNPLKRDKNGLWSTKLKLKRGSYEYKYVYDGMSYEPDPDRQQVPGPFGSANNLLVVA